MFAMATTVIKVGTSFGSIEELERAIDSLVKKLAVQASMVGMRQFRQMYDLISSLIHHWESGSNCILVPCDDTAVTISDCNVPDDQTLISEAEDQALPNSETCADSAFTVEVATSKMDEETSPLETGSLNKVATITEAMLHSEASSTASSESAFNKDH